jgi:hypothetical protein
MTLRTPPKQHDLRTREGKARRAGYLDAIAGKPISAAARGLPTWPAYEDGYAGASGDRSRHEADAAELACLRKKRAE